MKYRDVKQLLSHYRKRTLSLFLTVTTALSLTACSIQFSTHPEEKLYNLTDQTLCELYEELGEELETSPFTEDSMEELAGYVIETAKTTERIENVTFEQATLVRVIDGDTLVVSISGKEETVRLIGVNTPESVAPKDYRVANTKEGEEASAYVKALLSDVTTVYLQSDSSDRDRYDRLLRYVWLEIPKEERDIEEVAAKMLNGILVLEDIAEAVRYEPDTAYADILEELEDR